LQTEEKRALIVKTLNTRFVYWIIIGSDRRPETKQGIEGKIVRFRSGRIRVRLGIMITDLNQIAYLKLSILAPVKFRSPI